jgi:hypothetical protein
MDHENPSSLSLVGFVPRRHLFEAALITATCLSHDHQQVNHFRRALAHMPTDGVFSLDNLLAGEEILVRARVATRSTSHIRLTAPPASTAELLAVAYLINSPPSWLGAATRGDYVDYAFVPDDDAEALLGLVGDPDRRDELLLALGRTFDSRIRKELGLAAELVVVDSCREELRRLGHEDLALQVRHVSLVSDELGYDVRTPTASAGVLLLEVKCDSTSGPNARFFLSRNEWRTATRDSRWRLVVCRRRATGKIEVQGWSTGATIEPHLPNDTMLARWQSLEFSLPIGELVSGLPDLAI